MKRVPFWSLLGAMLYLSAGVLTYLGILACASKPKPVGPTFGYMVPQGTLATAGVEIISERNAFRLAPNQPFRTPFWSDCPAAPTPALVNEGEAGGGQRVRVVYPGLSQPLYGILSFCKLEDNYRGPASRSFQLQVPQSYVDATSGGRISVVYEPYDAKGLSFAAWALWLSREPIPARPAR